MMCRTFFQYEIIAPYCKYIEFFLISFFLSRTRGAISSNLCTKYNTILGEEDSRMIEWRALSFFILKTFWQLLILFFRNTLQYQSNLARTLWRKMNSNFLYKGERRILRICPFYVYYVNASPLRSRCIRVTKDGGCKHIAIKLPDWPG